MPVYEYTCQDCATRFEVRCSLQDVMEPSCPECKGKARRLFSPVPIIFRGPGFYVTDNHR